MSLNSPRGSGPKASLSEAPPGAFGEAGDGVTDAISREIVHVYLRTFGRGPTRVRTFVQPQYSVCVLRDVFTTAERAVIAAGGAQEVEAARKRLNVANDDDFLAIVESLTGHTVQSHVTHVKVPANLAVHVFLFDEFPAGQVREGRAG